MQNFLTSELITQTATAASTVTTEITTSAVNTAGYDRVVFIRSSSAVRTLKLQGGATSTSATTDITGASVTVTAGGVAKIEIHRPQYAFIRMTSTEGVTAVQGDAYAILGIARSKPVSNDSDVIVTTTTD
jgi:hypothetical protein